MRYYTREKTPELSGKTDRKNPIHLISMVNTCSLNTLRFLTTIRDRRNGKKLDFFIQNEIPNINIYSDTDSRCIE